MQRASSRLLAFRLVGGGWGAERVDDFDAFEIPFVVGYDDAATGLGGGGDDRVEGVAGAAAGLGVGH